MASSKKAKVYKIPEDLSSQRAEKLLDFLDLTPLQRAKVPLFFSKNSDSPLEKYKKHMNALMAKVHEKNKFTGEYGYEIYINRLPSAVERAIENQRELIDLKGEPHLVLQKLAVCLEYCTCDLEDLGKVYDVTFDVLGRIDDDAFNILMREKNKLKVSRQ